MVPHGFIMNGSEATDVVQVFKYLKGIWYVILDWIWVWMWGGGWFFRKSRKICMNWRSKPGVKILSWTCGSNLNPLRWAVLPYGAIVWGGFILKSADPFGVNRRLGAFWLFLSFSLLLGVSVSAFSSTPPLLQSASNDSNVFRALFWDPPFRTFFCYPLFGTKICNMHQHCT